MTKTMSIRVYASTLSETGPLLVMSGNSHATNVWFFAPPLEKISAEGKRAAMSDFKRAAELQIRSSPNQRWSQCGWLLVGATGKRCIPSTQFWLTVDSCAAYRFRHSAAPRVQVRLGNMGFSTALEDIQD